MDTLSTAKINSFGLEPKADAPTSEDVFILTARQLQAVVVRALQPLQDELSSLREERDRDREEMAAMKASLTSLIEEKREENIQEFNGICNSLMLHRQDIDKLSNPEPGEAETARAEKIRKYLQNRPDHKATYETLKGHLGVDKVRLSEAIKTLMATYPGQYGFAGVQGDKRKKALTMLPR